MSILLIGGMDRLKSSYIEEARKMNVDLKVFTKTLAKLPSRIGNVDAIIIFTNKVSHHAKREVMNFAKAKNIPIFKYHSCGICTLRDCLSCIKK